MELHPTLATLVTESREWAFLDEETQKIQRKPDRLKTRLSPEETTNYLIHFFTQNKKNLSIHYYSVEIDGSVLKNIFIERARQGLSDTPLSLCGVSIKHEVKDLGGHLLSFEYHGYTVWIEDFETFCTEPIYLNEFLKKQNLDEEVLDLIIDVFPEGRNNEKLEKLLRSPPAQINWDIQRLPVDEVQILPSPSDQSIIETKVKQILRAIGTPSL